MKSYYQQRISDFAQKLEKARKSANQFSILRGILFLLSISFLITFLSTFQDREWIWLILSLLFGLTFYKAMLHHLKLEHDITWYTARCDVNKEEVQRIDLDLKDLDNGVSSA